jgi:hypothetical protein
MKIILSTRVCFVAQTVKYKKVFMHGGVPLFSARQIFLLVKTIFGYFWVTEGTNMRKNRATNPILLEYLK